jgi:hypothetical protein
MTIETQTPEEKDVNFNFAQFFDDDKEETPSEGTPSAGENSPETPKVEVKPEETPSTQTPAGETPPTETPTPATAPVPLAEDPLQTRLRTLEEQNLRLQGQLTEVLQQQLKQTQEPPKSVETLETVLSGLDLDKVMESKESFVGFLQKYGKVIQDETARRLEASFPDAIDSRISHAQSQESIHREFYKEHPELKEVKSYVAQVAQQVYSENPTCTVPQVMTEAAKRAKKALGIKSIPQQTPTTPAEPPTPPALPGGSQNGNRPNGTPAKDEIFDLLKD